MPLKDLRIAFYTYLQNIKTYGCSSKYDVFIIIYYYEIIEVIYKIVDIFGEITDKEILPNHISNGLVLCHSKIFMKKMAPESIVPYYESTKDSDFEVIKVIANLHKLEKIHIVSIQKNIKNCSNIVICLFLYLLYIQITILCKDFTNYLLEYQDKKDYYSYVVKLIRQLKKKYKVLYRTNHDEETLLKLNELSKLFLLIKNKTGKTRSKTDLLKSILGNYIIEYNTIYYEILTIANERGILKENVLESFSIEYIPFQNI